MSNEPTITEVDGVKTILPAEQVADLQPKPEPAPEPAKTEEVQPEPKAEPEVKPEPEKEPEQPRDEQGKFKPKKAGPIAKLLEDRHALETSLSEKDKMIQELQAKLDSVSKQPPSQQAADKIKALAEKYDLNPEALNDIVSVARDGLKAPEIPKEVLELVNIRKAEAEQQAELAAFESRAKRLADTFPDEQFSDPKVKDKLLELAYSTDKAPDGEPYYQKELAELYFKYIKPTVEPGRKTAEASRGGSNTKTEVLDFAEIANDSAAIEKLDDAQWAKFSKWMQDTQKGSPLRRV